MRVWISGGGTAGHVYPGLTVRDALMAEASEPVAVTWVGTRHGMERRLMAAAGVPYRAVSAAPIVGASPARVALNTVKLAVGVLQSLGHMIAQRPHAVLVTGGYASVPVALAARIARIPLAVFLPDVVPGRAVSLVARLARLVICAQPEALPHLPPGRSHAVGYPVRRAVREARRDRARAQLGIPAGDFVLLVFGGSQGAASINAAVEAAASDLLANGWIVHVTGERSLARVSKARAALDEPSRSRWLASAYLDSDRMASVLAAADLVVSRAGAAVLGEYPALGLPSVLVPLDLAGGHQAHNAAILEHAGAAIIVANNALDGPTLARTVKRLRDDEHGRRVMGAAARRLDRPAAARDIASLVLALATRGARKK